MEQAEMPNKIKRILSTSMILTLISTFVVLFIGTSLRNLNRDVQYLNLFFASAENLQTNFEKSLQMYTESTQEIISYLLSLRPQSDEEYIAFISAVENIGTKLSLKLNLQSSDSEVKDALYYKITFYGKIDHLIDFLKELESLPYFIGVEEINFSNPVYLNDLDDEKSGNIQLKIRLFIK